MGLGDVKVFYFGCNRYAGHYMHRVGMIIDWEFMQRNPWGTSIDGGLCPLNDPAEVEGRALVHHKDGWTALSFWDRSIDKRSACNSAFLAEGKFTFDEMLTIAREHFPMVMQRFNFSIVPARSP